ncbi:MAG: hypothetical protein ACR2P9_08675 [Gammaproteobacteria bacterium]
MTITNDEFIFDRITIENAGGNGILTNDNFSAATVNVTNSIFTNNGLSSFSNPGDIQIFTFEGSVKIENVTITKAVQDLPNQNDNTYGIQLHGNTCSNNGDPPKAVSFVQSAILNNVTISGAPNKEGILIQCYSDVSNISFNDVDISGVTTSPGSFWPSALLVSHNGSSALDVGNLRTQEVYVANSGGVEARNATFFDASLNQIIDNITIESILTHIFDHSGLGEIMFFDEIIVGDQVDSTEQNLIIEESVEGTVQLPTNVTEIVLSDNTSINLNAGIEPVDMVIEISLPIPVTIEQEVTISSSNDEPIEIINEDLADVIVIIPDATLIQASNDWDGQILPPKEESFTGAAPTGFIVDSTVIEVGSPDSVLIFNNTASLILSGVTGNVGYKPSGSTQWIQITNSCGGTFAAPIDPVFPGECFISNGSDTKIVTFHFTSFGGLSTIPDVVVETVEEPKSKGGSGPTGVGPKDSKQSKTSLSSIRDWAGDSQVFRFAISHLIQEEFIDSRGIYSNGDVPIWIERIGVYWNEGQIDDEEFFEAMEYLIDQRILR